MANKTQQQHVEAQGEPTAEVEDKSPGVARIEAIVSTFTTTDRVLLYGGLTLTGYARGLSGLMLPAFQSAAIAEWNAAGQSSTLGVVRAAIAATSQPVWAKIMDNLGRTFVVFTGTLFYILGYIVMASARNFGTLAGGLVLQVFGFGAQNIVIYILVADTTNLRWRLLFSMIPAVHSIINVWAAGAIAARIMAGPGWRWGYGISSIIFPVLGLPLFLVMVWTTFRAKRLGLLNNSRSSLVLIVSPKFWRQLFWQADVVGLVFLAASIALCLIPLTLGSGSAAKWRTAPVLAPFLIGTCVALPAFVIWEMKGARHPILPLPLLKNKHIVISCVLGALFTITGAAQSAYLYFTLVVAFGKNVEVATRVSRLSSFISAMSGIILGFIIRFHGRPKRFTIIGCCMYLLAYGILYRYRGGHTQSEFAGLVGGEVILGMAMGVSLYAAQVSVQAVVGHEHVAIVTAVFFCCYQIGAGIGSAISGAIWTNLMPNALRTRLEAAGVQGATALAKAVYGNPLSFVLKNPPGTVARMAVDDAYRHLNRLLCISGICFSALAIVVSLFVDDVVLTNKRSIDDDDDWSLNSDNTSTTMREPNNKKAQEEGTSDDGNSDPNDRK